MVQVNCSHVKRITEAGIEYRLRRGETAIIDFSACSKNWINALQRRNPLAEIDNPILNRCVGDRYSGKYIEFYSDPHTQIHFRFSIFSCRHPMKEYLKLREKLREFGWTTAD